MKPTFLFLFLSLLLTSCQPKVVVTSTPTLPSDEILKAVVLENLKALEAEDFQRSMNTIHSESPAYEQTGTMLPNMFELYDLSYTAESIEVIKKDEKEAEVRVVQITKLVKGPEFRDNKIIILHQIIPENGVWKIMLSVIEDVKYLD